MNYRIISEHKLCYVDARGNQVGEARTVRTSTQVIPLHPLHEDLKDALHRGADEALELFKPKTEEMRPDIQANVEAKLAHGS